MGIDANAHLGSVPSPALGQCEAQDENHNGASLRATAEEHDLSVVNSFHNAGPTWTSSYNLKSRIDYLCVSQAMLRCVQECHTDTSIDLATAVRDDHTVLLARLQGLCHQSWGPIGT